METVIVSFFLGHFFQQLTILLLVRSLISMFVRAFSIPSLRPFFIHSFVHSSVLSVHPSIRSSVCSSVLPSVRPSVRPSVFPSVRHSVYSSARSFIRSFMHLFTHSFVKVINRSVLELYSFTQSISLYFFNFS